MTIFALNLRVVLKREALLRVNFKLLSVACVFCRFFQLPYGFGLQVSDIQVCDRPLVVREDHAIDLLSHKSVYVIDL